MAPGMRSLTWTPRFGGADQGRDHGVVGHEVGVGDVNGVPRRGESQQEHRIHRGAAARRGAAHHLGVDVTLRLEAAAREIFGPSERDARRLQPVFGKRALQLLDHRPFDPDIGVPPVSFLAPVTAPLAADARAARHANHAVDHEDAAMIAIVHPIDGERAQRPEALDPAADAFHRLAKLRGHRQRAHGVEQHVDLDAGRATLGQRPGDLLGGLAVLEDVLGVVDGATRAANQRDLRRKDLLAVQQDLHAVAADDSRARVRAERGRERRLLDVERRQLEVGWYAGAPRGDGEEDDKAHKRDTTVGDGRSPESRRPRGRYRAAA